MFSEQAANDGIERAFRVDLDFKDHTTRNLISASPYRHSRHLRKVLSHQES